MHSIVGRPVYERGIVSFIRVLGDLMPRRSRKVRALSCGIDESDTCGRGAHIMIICCSTRLFITSVIVLALCRLLILTGVEAQIGIQRYQLRLAREQLIGNFVRK